VSSAAADRLSTKVISTTQPRIDKKKKKMEKKIKTADVVIVGAGISGLAAADQLHRNGITDFVILEASGRSSSFKNKH
jgi:ribulose 1,5-bisphosphate synthetase/thiazole synthase